MPAAASLAAAANVAPNNALYVRDHADPAVTLHAQLTLWIAALADALDVGTWQHRTILDWIPPMLEVLDTLPTATASETFGDASVVGQVVSRSCRAAQVAATDSLISGAIEAAILADYNAIWFPP